MKILIVDDVMVVQMVIRKAVEKCDIADLEIKTAADGLAAYDMVNNWQPDLVITDWHMPVMSGMELLKKIYAKGMNHIKVGFITADPSEKNREQAMRFGADFMLGKPCQEEAVIAAIKAIRAKMPAKNTTKSQFFDSNLHSVINEQFGSAISIKEVESKVSIDFAATHLIALFGTPSSTDIKALIIMDKRCIYLLGGLINALPLDQAFDMSTRDDMDSTIAKLSTQFLTDTGARIIDAPINKDVLLKIKSKGIVPLLSNKIRETLDLSVSRKDFKLNHPDFGDCFLIIATL